MSNVLTVFEVLKRMFPCNWEDKNDPPYWNWTAPNKKKKKKKEKKLGPFVWPPLLPFDVFAISAHLLELSGAYHHIVPHEPRHSEDITGLKERKPAKRLLTVTPQEIIECRQIAKTWRRDIDDEPTEDLSESFNNRLFELEKLTEIWQNLFLVFGEEPVFKRLSRDDPPPEWWKLAHKLMMIADESCHDVGFLPLPLHRIEEDKNYEAPWFEDLLFTREFIPWVDKILGKLEIPIEKLKEQYNKSVTNLPQNAKDEKESLTQELNKKIDELIAENLPENFDFTGPRTLSSADANVVCVLPKARTSAVGCTLRSLSHHLALLPPSGVARARWYHPPPGTVPTDDVELNVLLVPFPFSIPDTAFKGVLANPGQEISWGLFEVTQPWLNFRKQYGHLSILCALTAFIIDLAEAAKNDHEAKAIDAIILPELALNYELFNLLQNELKKSLPELELMIAGTSTDETGRSGNFVAVSIFEKKNDNSTNAQKLTTNDKSANEAIHRIVREKHHRWKLDRTQLEAYGLGGALNPALNWWEDIDLLSRRVDFTVFRHTVMAAMICEDLARVDPCQELLRSIGPNLVVALLMDAPQLKHRWPSRHATVMAEDPGSAVLTLTSRGLMTRQHLLGTHISQSPEDRVIALWRDDFPGARVVEIACPPGCHGVWLKIWNRVVTDIALDGRTDSFGKRWIYGKHRSLRVNNDANQYDCILGQDELSTCRRQLK